MVLDSKSSDSSASFPRPLLNALKDFRTLRKSLTLQLLAWMRETIRSRSGRPLATEVKVASKVGWLMMSSTASSLCQLLAEYSVSEVRYIPGVERGCLLQWRTEPDTEQALSYPSGWLLPLDKCNMENIPEGVMQRWRRLSNVPSSDPSLFTKSSRWARVWPSSVRFCPRFIGS